MPAPIPARLPLTASSALASSSSCRASRLLCSESCLTSSASDASEPGLVPRSVVLDISPPSRDLAVAVALARRRLDVFGRRGALRHRLAFVVRIHWLAHQLVVVQPLLVRLGPLFVHARLGPLALGHRGCQAGAMLRFLRASGPIIRGLAVFADGLLAAPAQLTLTAALGGDPAPARQ